MPCPSPFPPHSKNTPTRKPNDLEGVIVSDKLLGEGSYGLVYRATYKGSTVAAKLMHNVLQESTHWYMQFQNEIKTMSKIRHPNIVRFIGEYESYIIMEYIEGGSLYRLVDYLQAREKTVSCRQKVSILGDIGRALNHLHNHHQIVHRDLSSPNVLLTKGLVAKVSDFAMSRPFNRPRVQPCTVAPGCPLYMPPEALVAGGEFTEKGDIHSFAIIALELINEEHPQPNQRENDLQKLSKNTCAISELTSLVGLVIDCLDCKPTIRPSSSVVDLELQRILESLPEGEDEPTGLSSPPHLNTPLQVSEIHQIASPRILLSGNGNYGSVLCPDQPSLMSVERLDRDSELGEESVDGGNCQTGKI